MHCLVNHHLPFQDAFERIVVKAAKWWENKDVDSGACNYGQGHEEKRQQWEVANDGIVNADDNA